jgi:ribonuclease HII
MPDFFFEKQEPDGTVVCGVDEAGRGPWAGPVIASAVILDRTELPKSLAGAINDSKLLSRSRRERIAAELPAYALIGVGEADVEEIDRINILQAALLAMQRAVNALGIVPAMALIDGRQAPLLPCPTRCIVHGDGLSLSIAAASIVAKVTRDRIMADLARVLPGYGFERNAGYGTAEHRAALHRLGPTPWHRRTFAPVRGVLQDRVLLKSIEAADAIKPFKIREP